MFTRIPLKTRLGLVFLFDFYLLIINNIKEVSRCLNEKRKSNI